MNNDISIRPAYLGSLPDQGFADQIGFVRPPRLSMLNDRFNPLDENGDPHLPPSLQLQVIMLWENDTRIYYPAGEYDPDSATPPSCYSDNLVSPSDGVMQPQSDLCANCPRAVRDQQSFKGTTLVSACKQRYKVACLVAGAGHKVFLLDIGPASRKAYAQYRNFLKQHHALPNQVITKLDYADKAFQFAFEAWINETTAEMVKRIAETDEPAMIVNAYDMPRQAALPAPKAVAQPAVGIRALTASGSFEQPSTSFHREEPRGGTATTASPTELPKRRGRPPKDAPPAAPQQATLFGPEVPAASAAQFTPQPSAPAPRGNGGFGMVEAQRPPENIQEALNRAFGP